MDYFQILIFLLSSCVFLLLQAILINGIKISASGTTKKSPMGRDIDSEMLLYPLYKYLTQHRFVPEYYQGAELDKLLEKISETGSAVLFRDAGSATRATPMVIGTVIDFRAIRSRLFGIDGEIKMDISEDMTSVAFYREIKYFRFSKYLRKPIIQCVICMASFWGAFTYWIPVGYVFGLTPTTFIFWIANTFCLSYVNFIIFKDHE